MNKTLLLCLLFFSFSTALTAQQDFFILKKGNKTLATYRKGFYIAFQDDSKEWITGDIMGIRNDSFFVRTMIVRYYLMGSDTTYYPIRSFSIHDIAFLPKRGVKIDYIKGKFRINKSAGHMHFYWIKSGWLFRVGGAGYILLNIINSALQSPFALSWGSLGIAAGVFLAGKILKRTYKVTMKIGKKYQLKYVKV